jgi:hypothetical protein
VKRVMPEAVDSVGRVRMLREGEKQVSGGSDKALIMCSYAISLFLVSNGHNLFQMFKP